MHASRGHIGMFEDQCEGCRAKVKRHHGCDIHPGHPQVWRKGNPCKTALVKDVMARSRKDAAGYVAEGNCALLPTEVMDMRNALLYSNDVEDFRLFVMVLLSIKLFLRSDEVVKMNMKDVIWDVSIVRNGIVDCIAFKIKGKSDKKPVTLSLWADNDVPQLCPIRHLLAYVHVTGIKNGI